VHLYGWLLSKYVTPHLGRVQLGQLDTPMIRQWRAKLLREGVSESMAANAYRLLRAVLMTAANEDRIIPRNPCQVRGAGSENPDERPVLNVAQVFDLASRMAESRYRTEQHADSTGDVLTTSKTKAQESRHDSYLGLRV
jgi:hypothetical protein